MTSTPYVTFTGNNFLGALFFEAVSHSTNYISMNEDTKTPDRKRVNVL